MRALCPLLLLAACQPDDPGESQPADSPPPGDSRDSGPVEPLPPGPEYDRFCAGQDWEETLQDAVVGPLSGSWCGSYTTLDPGTLFTMKMIPEHPFHLTGLRVGLAGQDGPVRFRLVRAWGRTYPDLDREDADLMDPIELTADVTSASALIDLPVVDPDVYLLPTQHYVLLMEQLDGGPGPAIETVPEGEYSRALVFFPGDENAYGVDGNFRFELVGQSICAWEDDDRWFGELQDAPWAASVSARVTVVAGGVTQVRDVRGNNGQGANQTTRWVHFGLGDNEQIESVQIRWPGGAGTQVVEGLEADHRYTVSQGGQVVD